MFLKVHSCCTMYQSFSTAFFSWLNNIPLYAYTTFVYLLSSSAGGHSGCFHLKKTQIHFLIIKGTWHVTDKLWFLKKLPSYTVRTQPFPTHCSILLCAVGPALTALIQNPRAFWLLQREAKDRLSETLKPQNIHYWRDGQTPHGKSGSIKYTGK